MPRNAEPKSRIDTQQNLNEPVPLGVYLRTSRKCRAKTNAANPLEAPITVRPLTAIQGEPPNQAVIAIKSPLDQAHR